MECCEESVKLNPVACVEGAPKTGVAGLAWGFAAKLNDELEAPPKDGAVDGWVAAPNAGALFCWVAAPKVGAAVCWVAAPKVGAAVC